MPELCCIVVILPWILFYVSTFYIADSANLCGSSLPNRLGSLKKLAKNSNSFVVLDSRALSASCAIGSNNT